MPEIFTQTPLEAHIQALFLRAQIAAAQLLGGNYGFRLLLLAGLTISIVLSFAKIAGHKHHAALEGMRVLYRVACFFLALALLHQSVPSVSFSSPTRGAWSTRNGVQADARLASTLTANDNMALYWYTLMYRGINGAARALSSAVSAAFSDETLQRDPTFLVKELSRMGAMSLSPAPQAQLLGLLRNCSDTRTGRLVTTTSNVRDLLDLTPRPDRPGVDCQAMWNDFQGSLEAEKERLVARYPPTVWNRMGQALTRVLPGTTAANWNERLRNAAVASAILTSTQNAAGYTRQGSIPGPFGGVGYANTNANAAATMSTGAGDTLIEETSQGIGHAAMTAAEGIAGFLGVDGLRKHFDKAEAANKFNQVSAYIPVARGFMQGILAVLFALAAYSVGFGTWKGMWAWTLAQITLSLYSPVAALAWKVANYFDSEAKLTNAIQAVSTDPTVLGGARVLQDQLVRVQTVYIWFEIGVFSVFALGAIAAFRPLASMTGHLGDQVAGGMVSAGTRIAGMVASGGVSGAAGAAGAAGATGAAGGQEIAVIVNGRTIAAAGGVFAGGGAGDVGALGEGAAPVPALPAGEAAAAAAVGGQGGGGLITPSKAHSGPWEAAT